jgi:hypothetical protein
MDLNSLAQIAQVLSGIAVVVAIVFGLVQARQFKQQRRDAADVELMRSMQDREFTRSFRLIYSIQDNLSASGLRALGPEYEEAAIALGARFESMGMLVFRGSIPLDLVEKIVGGVIVVLWRKLKLFVIEYRAEQKHELLFEWFQWLAERIEERGRTAEAPAYKQHSKWTPKR